MHTDRPDFQEITLKVTEISKLAGKYISEQCNLIQTNQIETKGEHNYVTYVDKTAESLIVDALRKLLPNAGFITEEGTAATTGAVYNWIIDPLDGTTNFIHRVPLFCVSIALKEQEEIVAGVIYEINHDECFYAWKNGPAMLNGQPIQVSGNHDWNSALIATGFPYYDYGRMDAYLDVFKEMIKETSGLRRLGSAAADMAYVAAGRFEGFYEYGLHAWDVAAGIIIVKQAGGIVQDFNGGNNTLFGKELVCGNQTAVHNMQRIIKKYF